jgi:DNA-binding CsgD family transcriptional regulator
LYWAQDGVIYGVVEDFSPLSHYLGVSINTVSPLYISDNDSRSKSELEKLAVVNLQNIIYQANMDQVEKWTPLVCSALKVGKIGEVLIHGYGQYAVGDHDALKASLRALEIEESDPKFKVIIEFESTLLRMRNEFTFGNFEKVEQIYEKLPDSVVSPINRTDSEHFSKHRSSLVAAFYMQDKDLFAKHYAKIENNLIGEYGTIQHLNISSFRAMNSFLNGRYIEANEYALAACKLADELNVSGAYTPFEAAYVLADTYLEFGEDKKSFEISEKYLEIATKFEQYPWISAFYAKLALLKLQEGNISAALSAIRSGREKINSSRFNSNLSLPLDVHELLIRMQLNDMERIKEIIPRLPNLQMAEGFKMAIQVMNNPASVAGIAQMFPEANDQDKFRKELTLAVVNSENRPQAIKHLERALELAEQNGYLRSFLNMPQEVKSLVLDITTAKPTIYAEKVAKAIRAQASMLSRASISDHTPLTKRELDVLRRLETNVPITKIAATLHISNNTIKTHLKNVYRKLNVESRDEAVARGKELSLL